MLSTNERTSTRMTEGERRGLYVFSNSLTLFSLLCVFYAPPLKDNPLNPPYQGDEGFFPP